MLIAEVRRGLVFRWQLFAMIVGKIMSVWLYKILWTAVYDNRSIVADFELKDILTYYVIIAAIQPLVSTRVDRQIGRGIQSGDIANELLRPLPLYRNLFMRNVGQAVSRLFIESLPLLAVAMLIVDMTAPTSLVDACVFVLACALAHLLAFNISIVIGSLSFWVTGIEGPLHLKNFLFMALSGALIPVSFFRVQFKESYTGCHSGSWLIFHCMCTWECRRAKLQVGL
jgi:ABC-2 type transport system permease protein